MNKMLRLETCMCVVVCQDLTSVQNLQKKHALLEADVSSRQVRVLLVTPSQGTCIFQAVHIIDLTTFCSEKSAYNCIVQ